MRSKPAFLVILAILAVILPREAVFSKKAVSKESIDRRSLMLRAMAQEMDRSLKRLSMPGYDLPYFLAYEMKDTATSLIQALYGAVYKSASNRSRQVRVEVRVGSYEFDNIGSKTSEFDFSHSPSYRASTTGPLDDDPPALRNTLWLLTDQNYKAALKAFLKRKGKKVTEVDEGKNVNSFSKESPAVHSDPAKPFTFDQNRWERVLRSASALFEGHPAVFDSFVNLEGGKQTRYLINSEGSRIITENSLYSISFFGAARASDGMLLTSHKTVYATEESRLPPNQEIFDTVNQLVRDLEVLCNAQVLEPYTGPAILDGEATGVLFHEVIGHRLEGERQLDEEEGKTFKGQVGKQIIPDFLSVIDDPTVAEIDRTALNGFYRFDDEAVRARRVLLIDRGILKTFLTSRTPIEDFPHSNGHGRSETGEKPRARMGNTIVLSNRKVSFEKLKQMLIEEVKKQKKPYGLIIKNIIGGSTHTSSWGYQAYKGVPEMVYRVFPDGREDLVRGVEIVGTPIASINKIVATSDRVAIFNGFCGAESGYIPVSAVAPDVLMTEIEVQRTRKKSEKGPVLPSPWTGPAGRSEQHPKDRGNQSTAKEAMIGPGT